MIPRAGIKIVTALTLLYLAASCTTTNLSSSLIEEDKLYKTRIFVGNFIDFRHTNPDFYGNPDLIWIETTLDSVHGKISAFSRECRFAPGERLYLNRTVSVNGKEEKWVYQIENNDTLHYVVNEYQNHNNVIVKTLFNNIPDKTSSYYSVSTEAITQRMSDKDEPTLDSQ